MSENQIITKSKYSKNASCKVVRIKYKTWEK
jgi:hypothetical protein